MRGKRVGILVSVSAMLAATMAGVVAPGAQATNHIDGSFEVDGNEPDSGAGEPLDWQTASPAIAVTPFTDDGNINAVYVLVHNALGIVIAEVIVAHAHSDTHHP